MGSRINIPDLAFGILLLAVAVFTWVMVADLPVGTATSMGPGYVPRGLALLIGAFGLVQGGRALLEPFAPFPAVAIRPLLLVGAAVAVFAVVLRVAGLAITSAAVIVVAGFAAYDVRPTENLLLALGLAVFSVLLFVLALGLPIPIWPQ